MFEVTTHILKLFQCDDLDANGFPKRKLQDLVLRLSTSHVNTAKVKITEIVASDDPNDLFGTKRITWSAQIPIDQLQNFKLLPYEEALFNKKIGNYNSCRVTKVAKRKIK